MSLMVPSFINHRVKSSAEKRIFEWFRTNTNTDGWTVLYSQVEINHDTLILGESDFVVIAPKKGIFVLEVKGGRVYRDEKGIWHFVDRFNHDSQKSRGPFEQASDGMFSLRRYLESKHPELKKLLWGYGVMFPDMESFFVTNDEFSSSMVFDKTMGNRVDTYIDNLSKYWKKKIKEKTGITDFSEKLPTPPQCKIIKEVLRPSFDFIPSMSSLIDDAVKQISLNDREYTALDATEDNKHCLFVGGAGTGKTLIAKEIVRRSSEKNICFLCFNRNLSEWLKKDFETEGIIGKCSFVGDFHSLVVENIKKAGLLSQIDWSNKDPFNVSLMNLFFRSLEISSLSFNYLIVDEFQDFLDENDNCLLAFDYILVQGLCRGHYTFLGDFENQSLYHPFISEDEAVNKIQVFGPVAKWRLTINCRNTPEICKTIREITGVTYKNSYSELSHIETSFIQYSDEDDEQKKLDSVIKEMLLKDSNLRREGIMILSPKKREKSVMRLFSAKEIPDFSIPQKPGINFSTIFGFKGLECPIVFLVDIEGYSNTLRQNNESLIYVGISRAKAKLFIFETNEASIERIGLLEENNNGR
jgi:hypothetical protein